MEADTTFNPIYSPELVQDASRAFVRRYLAGRYGALLAGSTVVNVAGISLAYWLGADRVPLAVFAVLVALSVVYFVSFYLRRPARLAERMLRTLDPKLSLRVDAQGILARGESRQACIEWSSLKSILELHHCFLAVISPVTFVIVPKAGLPAESADLLRRRVTKA